MATTNPQAIDRRESAVGSSPAAPPRLRLRREGLLKRMAKTVLRMAVLFAAFGALATMYLRKSETPTVTYRVGEVNRGNLLVSIGATGTVEPEELVDVGAQIAGQITAFGKDKDGKTVDYGSAVHAGDVLALIDDSIYRVEVTLATAQLEEARASLLRSEADLQQLETRLDQAQRDWERSRKLYSSQTLAQSTYETDRTTLETSKANVAVGKAAVVQAKASVAAAEAVLQRAQRNLGYCTIKSPVNGVIIDREVNIGQTVVASMNAPSLFLVAKDLKRMQVWVAVNEADIGRIYAGQPVSFTVDAYPGEAFHGSVNKVRLNAKMTQNVVTYTVEVTADNSDGRLLPYLTANVQFEMGRRDNVLRAPNAALRWTPRTAQVAAEYREESSASSGTAANAAADPTCSKENVDARPAVLWVRHGEGLVRPVHVTAGLSDGLMTEVEGEGVREGMEVVIGEQDAATAARQSPAASAETTNPFTPKLPKPPGPPPR